MYTPLFGLHEINNAAAKFLPVVKEYENEFDSPSKNLALSYEVLRLCLDILEAEQRQDYVTNLIEFSKNLNLNLPEGTPVELPKILEEDYHCFTSEIKNAFIGKCLLISNHEKDIGLACLALVYFSITRIMLVSNLSTAKSAVLTFLKTESSDK